MQDGILAKAQVEQAVARGMNVKGAYGQMRSSLITLRHVKNVFYGGFTVLNPTLDYNDPNAKLDYQRSTVAG